MLVLIKSTPMSAAPHQEIVVETVDDEEEDPIDGSSSHTLPELTIIAAHPILAVSPG